MTDITAGPAPAPKLPHGGACCHIEGATGVSKQGTSMVCQPAKDGRLRWHRDGAKPSGGGKAKTSHGYAGPVMPATPVITAEQIAGHQTAIGHRPGEVSVSCTCGQAVTLDHATFGGSERAAELARVAARWHRDDPANYPLTASHPSFQQTHTVSTFADPDAQAVILTCVCGQTGMVPFIGWGPAGAQRQADADADAHHRDPQNYALRDRGTAQGVPTRQEVDEMDLTQLAELAEKHGHPLTVGGISSTEGLRALLNRKLDAERANAASRWREVLADPAELSGELNAAHREHMKATAMADGLDEAVRSYMESGDTNAAADADRVARQYRRGQLTDDDVNDAMERIAERSASEAPKLSGDYNTDVEMIPNSGVSLNPAEGKVAYHEDSYLADALRNMGSQGRHLDVDGDTLANVVGKISADSIAGRITPQQEIDELRRLRGRIPNGHPAQTALSTAIANMDSPYIPVPAIPKGTPAPLRQLVEQLHDIPLARSTRVSRTSVDPDPSEVTLAHDILDGWHRGDITPTELLSTVRVLARRRHESNAGKVQLDRAVDQAAAELKQMVESNHPVFAGRL